ncbi:hypothetical protein PR202_ga16118 [Eleusine coracana subsp. coracana]|uniref:SAM-dependent MTase DRM-type domain-containing protein n=1 Tax=Eleusine coracana subsp. coracana TaxID=191504 RepID=A0AAV5CLX6_ELECO|nr:hypothetical protein PR202_ga16118 [Eleusine coracana subsp. coracana]
MTGFNLPIEQYRSGDRPSSIPTQTTGPPYFYYENVVCAPKVLWATMSRFLYDIEPEFVDSEFICAAGRKRGYIHNLLVQNRSFLDPLPPETVFEAFTHVKKWWPSWDSREKLNCLGTFEAIATTLEHIRLVLANSQNAPPPSVQKFVMKGCRKGNLIWIGKNRFAPLEPHEIERLLGFPEHHTRCVGGATQRYQSLGKSFQMDTVVYHLSVLKDIFPHGMNVLTLFSGIGGAEVALHKLGIHLKNVVLGENSKTNRAVYI